MVTTTKKEEAELELAAARVRLQKAEGELEFYRWRQDEHDERQHAMLLIEADEASRLLMHARQALDAL
jgi:hypothetical protein